MRPPSWGLIALTAALAGGGAAEERVSVELREAPLDHAIRTILRKSPRSFALHGPVDEIRISLKIDGATPDEAFQQVYAEARRRQPDLKLARFRGAYILRAPHNPDEPPEILRAGPATLKVVDLPLRAAVDLLFYDTGIQYAFDPNVPDIRVSAQAARVSFSLALRHLLAAGRKQVPGLTASLG